MFFIGFISNDGALSHALSEQFRQNDDWQHAIFVSLEDALAAWSASLPSLIVWDVETAEAKADMIDFFSMKIEDSHPHPILLTIGGAQKVFQDTHVTEKLTRPLRLGYLLARIHFYQRLLQQVPDVSLRIGSWLFEPRAHRIVSQEGGEAVKLTEKEVALLEYLYAAKEPVFRDELLASIWHYEANIDTHTLETHIYRLRKKLMSKEDTEDDVFISGEGRYQINPIWRS